MDQSPRDGKVSLIQTENLIEGSPNTKREDFPCRPFIEANSA